MAKSPKSTPIHKLHRPGLRIYVYPNRVEITKTRGCFLLSSTRRIPFSAISNVDYQTGSETLTIELLSGKKEMFRLGGFGGAAKGVADAIIENM